MRVRLLRPEILDDEVMADLPDAVALFYMKLWLVTDDEGYFDWNERSLAAQLFPYKDRGERVPLAEEALTELVRVGRVRRLECLTHGLVPSMPRHRIQAGRQSAHVRREHRASCTGSERVRSLLPSESETESETETEVTEETKNGREPSTRTGLKARLGSFEEVVKPK